MKNSTASHTALPLFFLMIVSVFSTAALGQALKGKPGPTPTPTPVPAQKTVSFGYCAAGDVTCETANRLRNDANRAYADGTDVAIAFQTGSGSNDITLNFSRNVIYDFTYMAAAGNPTPTWVSQPQAVKPFINVLGGYNAKLQCGNAATCDINYVTGMNGGGFTIDRITYRVQWHPTSVQPYINTPEVSSAVNVHYVKDANGEVFTITPLPNTGTSRMIAGLQGETSRSITAGGQYVVPFTMTVKLQ
jgi:hypothetical protein